MYIKHLSGAQNSLLLHFGIEYLVSLHNCRYRSDYSL